MKEVGEVYIMEFKLDGTRYSINITDDLVKRYVANDPDAIVEVEARMRRALRRGDYVN